VAVNRGDKDSATKMMEKVITVDPMSPEAAQAKAIIEQLKK
jgi:Tfp pilus assembly protein PilF